MERRFLGIKELAEYMGIKKSTLYSWVHQKAIPHYKIGRLPKFDITEINTWIQGRKVKAEE